MSATIHTCEFRSDGVKKCDGAATYKLVVQVTDRDRGEPTEHFYCLFHGPIAKEHVDDAAKMVGRSRVVLTKLEAV